MYYDQHVTKRPSTPIDQRIKRWHQLTATPAPFQVDSIEITESNFFANQVIKLDRIVAFIGVHGTGKSLLLRILEASFGYTTPVYSPPFLRDYSRGASQRSAISPLTGVVEVSLRTPSGRIRRRVDLSQPPESRAQIWKEIFGESFMAWYVDPIGAFSDLDYIRDNYDYMPGQEPFELERRLSSVELDALNNILGRRYDSVTIRTTSADGADTPVISAKLGSKIFHNTIMSQGELWVHYINWFLELEKDKGHLALIDEPESFLAAQGRRAFIDQIARSALRSHRQVVIGTHSPEILSRFPLANIRMCIPGDSGAQIITPRSIIQVRDCVGIQTSIRGLALVEDELAKQMLTTIFARYDTALTREVEIIQAGGAAGVASGTRILEKADRLRCFAVFDGDQRTHQSAELSESSARAPYFLPGTECPESQLMSSALEQIDWLAETIGVHTDRIYTAISTCRHLDHQYRLGRIAEQLGYREETLTQIFIHAWLRRHEIAQEAERLAGDIRSGLL